MKTLLIFLLAFAAYAEEPNLPSGLGASDEPGLPAGLGSESSEPTFVMESQSTQSEVAEEHDEEDDEESALEYSGFIDVRGGTRLQDDPVSKQESLGEVRVHNDFATNFQNVKFRLIGDLIYDSIEEEKVDTKLNEGSGIFDLREFNFSARPNSFMDVKVGRQILTWGTGDMIFVNDLFPKDWQSFFVGRDLTYLKAPSDALKVSFFTNYFDLDVILTPEFDSDRHIDGSRNSYFSPQTAAQVGRQTPFSKQEENGAEVALRLKKRVGSSEFALYGYDGFWKSPMGMTTTGQFYFPELAVYGASLVTPLSGGIFNFEGGYYDSKEDRKGTNPFIPNSEIRLLAGYEHELIKNSTGSIQYYVEQMQDYANYRANFMGTTVKDESRHMVTLKVRREMMRQTLSMTAMLFYSPTDQDGHYRLSGDYKMTDNTKFTLGVNGFFGEQPDTFWGQFEDNSNIYTGFTYNF